MMLAEMMPALPWSRLAVQRVVAVCFPWPVSLGGAGTSVLGRLEADAAAGLV